MRNQYVGVVVGTVKEIDPENASVKLEFPWLEEAYRSDWAPIATPLAGAQRGMYFMPEIDDDVLVSFDRGDFDSPYVVGFIWNGIDMPPETEGQNRIIKTPGGHTLRFEDQDSAKKIVIKSDSGHHITIDDSAQTVTVSDSGGSNQVVIQSQSGTVKVQAASKVVVAAPQIELTQGAVHPLVYGDQLMTYLAQLVAMLQSHTHPGQLAAGFIPVTPMTPGTSFPTYQSSYNSTQVKTG